LFAWQPLFLCLSTGTRIVKPGAPVVIVEKNTEVRRRHRYHFMTREQIAETVEDAGFELEKTETALPRDTIYVIRVGD
jgi:hypothetical protein